MTWPTAIVLLGCIGAVCFMFDRLTESDVQDPEDEDEGT